MSEIAYKVLQADGRSIYRHWRWPLPAGDTPGAWVDAGERDLVLCAWGLHGYLSRDWAESEARSRAGALVYEMEIEGDVVRDDEKMAGRRARLTRLISGTPPPPFVPIQLEPGILPCETCGKVHARYRIDAGGTTSWADPTDGHAYAKVGWETFAAHLPPGAIVEASNALAREAGATAVPFVAGQAGYWPVVPSFHKGPPVDWPGHPGRCGTCGLGPELHDGWEERAEIAEEFKLADRWQLMLVVQRLLRRIDELEIEHAGG